MADKLNAAGLTTGHGHPFDTAAVQWIRHAYCIPAPTPYAHGEINVADAASRLGCKKDQIRQPQRHTTIMPNCARSR
jgi:hypothetical protein